MRRTAVAGLLSAVVPLALAGYYECEIDETGAYFRPSPEEPPVQALEVMVVVGVSCV
jgi:hypothetical protein